MAVDEATETAIYGLLEPSNVTSEQMALIDFAYRMGCTNFTNDAGIAEEGSTRQEATLLMSLLGTIPRVGDEVPELTSSSGSEQSYVSDSSTSRRDTFSFTCPSLSLENMKPSSKHIKSGRKSIARKAKDSNVCGAASPRPSELLGRQLKVDDRDALRLSADAMARNVLQSFQKAIDWRINSWIHSLSRDLVKKEQEMKATGATEDELKSLLRTSEACLIVNLRGVAERISVTDASTNFRVLRHRIEDDIEEEPTAKRPRLGTDPLEEFEYQYSVTHSLVLEGVVTLQTPAGFSEVTVHVPGTMRGTFFSAESEGLTSVVVDLETEVLAAMVEKSSRKIVRASVEALMEAPTEESFEEESNEVSTLNTQTQPQHTVLSPPPVRPHVHRTAIVTPRAIFSDSSELPFQTTMKPPILLPIPDDFDRDTYPRRISPQPSSPDFFNMPFSPRTPMKRNSFGPPLISPPPCESHYHEMPENGPSLPMLVEVACREMESN